jgi:peptide-methionine (S)-S-oxide reductase
MAKEVATLAGGCFWCIEAAFNQMQGVDSAISGYIGGAVADPTYEQVCGGRTGHAEAVQVTYDPALLDYRTVLEAFFSLHDPTTLNRQGNDEGTQYRSAVFTHGPGQEKAVRKIIAELEAEAVWDGPIVTEVAPAGKFWPAEEYHQRYYERNPNAGYCMAVVRPKLAKFQKAWKAKLKA